jgi:hypothetical protein
MAKQQETDFVKEALLDIQSIKAALTENAKETLRAIAREEIDSVINESLSEANDFEEEDVEGEMEGSEEAEAEADVDVDPYDGEAEGDELDVDSLEGDDELEIELDDTEMGGDEELDMDDMDVVDVDLSDAPDEEEIDLTDASDDMVLSVYKELTDTDEIEVIGDEIHMDIKEPGKFILKPKQSAVAIEVEDEMDMEEEMEEGMGMGMEEEMDMDEAIYEVYMDEEAHDMEEGYEMEMEMEADEEDMLDEAIPVGIAQARRMPGRNTPIKGAGAKGVKVESKVSEYEKLLTESKKLKKENEIFKENLISFRKTLAETALYNFNLTYVTKVFLEHATTKDEKISIMERFDGVKSIKESKVLYDKIVNEMGSRKTISESVSKLDRSVASGKSNLSEHTAYVDNETARIRELMERVEGKKLL